MELENIIRTYQKGVDTIVTQNTGCFGLEGVIVIIACLVYNSFSQLLPILTRRLTGKMKIFSKPPTFFDVAQKVLVSAVLQPLFRECFLNDAF